MDICSVKCINEKKVKETLKTIIEKDRQAN